jgi:hypothetical protein
VHVDFVGLTGHIAFNTGCDEVVHMGPLVVFGDEVNGF